MLPAKQQVAFVIFALACVAVATRGFQRLLRRMRRGRPDSDTRLNGLPRRVVAALWLTVTQSRTFRKRPWVSFFHSLVFYGFVVYLAVNAIDALQGFVPLRIDSETVPGAVYHLAADVLSALVLVGVMALVLRRFLLPSRRDFRFNPRTLLHEDLRGGSVRRDSVIVSTFILFHVGSRAIGAAAKLAEEGADRWQPFASMLARAMPRAQAHAWEIAGYWGALGSVLAFLAYFPYTKHLHLLLAPVKYAVAREEPSGVLPAMQLDVDAEEPRLGAETLEDLRWPALLDAYACIQCNRCQDVCPATATGKALSPAALEINKRLELNRIARAGSAFEEGGASPRPLLAFALSAEAAWACTTCGACVEVCPVGDEPMLDIVEVRRQQVMMAGEFPAQLQSAFRGMERAGNPWGIGREQRLEWARGLSVPTVEERPDAAVLYWVGCAPSYDPQAQKTARAFVQLMQAAGVDFAVLGKREQCTGDSARRSGNEYLYRQLAEENVTVLDAVKPRRIVTTCPHCLNALGQEYRQLGGTYDVVHHTALLAELVGEGKLQPRAGTEAVAFHDPCYLGRHNGVYDAPRNLLRVLSNDVRELPRARENSFCCGAGGAQFWKEEEPGEESIASNRVREAATTLGAAGTRTLAVGCPFCKSMLSSSQREGEGEAMVIRDVAEMLWRAVGPAEEEMAEPVAVGAPVAAVGSTSAVETGRTKGPGAERIERASGGAEAQGAGAAVVPRAKWQPKTKEGRVAAQAAESPVVEDAVDPPPPVRKKWTPGGKAE